jgi:aspartyl/asparaginyl beta-hydroxylase (cupin superfamily)
MIQTRSINEPVYYYLSNRWYGGKMPVFYDSSKWELTHYLKHHYEEIKEEILNYYGSDPETLQANFTPYNYSEKGWKTINLYTYGHRYPDSCKQFPVLDSIVRKIPNMTMCQIAVLEPGIRVKAHLGDTNAIIRNHLGIVVPAGLPEVGLRAGKTDQPWVEGEVFSFCIVHRHYAWNYADSARIVLIVDVMHPDYADQQHRICAEAMALIAMKFVTTRIPILKKVPRPIKRTFQRILGVGFRLRTWIQRSLQG